MSLRAETQDQEDQGVTVLCKRLKLSNISFLTALFTASLQVSTFCYLAQTTNSGTLGLFLKQNSHQLGSVAHHIHLCFQASMSDVTTGSTPQTVKYKMKMKMNNLDDCNWLLLCTLQRLHTMLQ